MAREKMEMKASGTTAPNKLAGAIIMCIRDDKQDADIACIGAGAVNQAMKAVAIARGMGAPSGVDIVALPYFVDIEEAAELKTSLHILVQGR